MDVFSAFLEFLDNYAPDIAEGGVLLACSAGKDSVTLFDMFLRYKKISGCPFQVFHLDHCTRNGASRDDADFIESLCQNNDIEFHRKVHDFGSVTGFENTARAFRYKYLEEQRTLSGLQYAATAHTASDNAETVLMRIVRGTGLYGLRGIPAKREHILRPIIHMNASMVYDYLASGKLEWREDQSNMDTSYTRNYVRHIVMPELAKLNPQVEQALNNLSVISIEMDELLAELAEQSCGDLIHHEDNAIILYLVPALENEKLLRYYISKVIHEIPGAQVDGYMLKAIIDTVYFSRKKQCEIFRNCDLVIYLERNEHQKWLKIIPAGQNIEQYILTKFSVSSGKRHQFDVRGKVFQIGLFDRNSVDCDYITIADTALNDVEVIVRQRKSGDIIVTRSGTRTLKKLYIDRKIPLSLKSEVPVIEIEGIVRAVLFSCINYGSDVIRCDTGTAKKVLAIRHLQDNDAESGFRRLFTE